VANFTVSMTEAATALPSIHCATDHPIRSDA
jgi:hypothetical protein